MATSEQHGTRTDTPGDEKTSEQQSPEARMTDVHQSEYGDSAILSLGGADLRKLGINPDNVDAVRYQVFNGALLVEPVE